MRSERGVGTAFAVTSVGSVQFGAALAATLFPRVGPLGTVTLRLVGASLAMSLVTRPWRIHWDRTNLRAAAVFGAVLATMNTCIYLAIDRLPLATVITLEFLGPLGVAVITATTWRQRGWAVPAAIGVALLGGSLNANDVLGVALALVAALSWAAYILLSRRMGDSEEGLAGLCVASILGATVMVPVGFVAAGSSLVRPSTVVLGADRRGAVLRDPLQPRPAGAAPAAHRRLRRPHQPQPGGRRARRPDRARRAPAGGPARRHRLRDRGQRRHHPEQPGTGRWTRSRTASPTAGCPPPPMSATAPVGCATSGPS